MRWLNILIKNLFALAFLVISVVALAAPILPTVAVTDDSTSGTSEDVEADVEDIRDFREFVIFDRNLVLGEFSDNSSDVVEVDSRASGSVLLTNSNSEHNMAVKRVEFLYSNFAETFFGSLEGESVPAREVFDVEFSFVGGKKARFNESVEISVSSLVPSNLSSFFEDRFGVSADGNVLIGSLVLDVVLKENFKKVVSVYLKTDNSLEIGGVSLSSYSGNPQAFSSGDLIEVGPGDRFRFSLNVSNLLSDSSLEEVRFGVHEPIGSRTTNFVSFSDVELDSIDAGGSVVFSVDASIDGFVSDGSETELSLFVSGVDSSGVIHGDSVDVKFVVDRLGRSLVPALDLNVAGYACGDSHVLPVSLFNGGLTGEENVTLMFEVPQLGVLESVTVPSLGMSESFDHNFAVDIPNVKSGNYSARLSGFYGSELGGEYVFDFPVSCDDYNLFKSEFVEWFFLILGYGLVVGGFVFLYLNGFGKKRK